MNRITTINQPMPRGDVPSPVAPATEVDVAQRLPIILQYWQVLLRWKWVALSIIVVALAVGLIATLLMTPNYTATSRIEISREQQNFTNVQGVETSQSFQDDEFYQTQYSNLEARSLAARVAQELRLARDEQFFAAHGVEIDAGSDDLRSRTDQKAREEAAIDLLLANVTIAPIVRSRLVDIRYTSASPNISATIANAWAEQFIASTTDRRFASTSDAREFLEQRLGELAQRLEESERRAVNFADAKDIVPLGNSVTPDGRTMIDRTLVSTDLEALNEALATATAERIAAQSRVGSRANSSEVAGNATLSALRQRLAQAEAEYDSLMVQFEPGYPRAREVSEQIERYRAAIAEEEARLTSGKTADYRDALGRESELRQRVNALKAQLSDQQRASIQYNIFKREADTNRQLYDSLLQRYKEIGVAGVGVNNIAIVDPAQVPSAPTSPNLPLNMALALLAGIGLAALGVIGLEQIDEGLRDPSSVGSLLGIPLLGTVPKLTEEDAETALADSKSELAEAYFSVRSNLSFATEHGFPQSLMVTSSRPAEGKTTSCVALAIALGRSGKSVLLIDGDMRSPSCHEYFDQPNEVGLSNALTGDDNWADFILPTQYRGLSLISAGPIPPSAAELYSSDRLKALIARAIANYDHVLVDAPPLLGLADAPLISQAVEGVAFVIETEGVAVRGLRTAIARLRQAHARIFGAIITMVDTNKNSYGYGYGYGSGYGYGEKKAPE